MKYSRERFQNGSLRRVSRKTGPDVWEFRFRDHSKPGLPMRQKTFSTVENPTESAARRALQAFLLKINGSEAYIAQRSPTFGTVLDKFIADERLREIKAYRPGETVDEGLKFSTTMGVLVRHQGASAAILEQGAVDGHQASRSSRVVEGPQFIS
jgi:integrase